MARSPSRRPSYPQRILPPYLQRALWFAKGWAMLRYHGVQFRGKPNIRGKFPQIENEGEMRFGPEFSILGRMFRVGLVTTPGAVIEFGTRVHLNQGSVVYAAERVTIGDHCLMGDLVTIYDTSFHQLDPGRPVHTAAITIGNNVWIGRGATVLPGVTIGDHAVIAAGAIVSRDVPARSVAAGSPARVVGKELDVPDDTWWRM